MPNIHKTQQTITTTQGMHTMEEKQAQVSEVDPLKALLEAQGAEISDLLNAKLELRARLGVCEAALQSARVELSNLKKAEEDDKQE